MSAIAMAHDTDPREDIIKRVGRHLNDVVIMGSQVLVGIYVRPKITARGIHLPDQTRDEDKWQGKVGLVLMKGPMAFVDDGETTFAGQTAEVGQWVAFRVADGWSLKIGDVDCRLLSDTHIRMVLPTPDGLW